MAEFAVYIPFQKACTARLLRSDCCHTIIPGKNRTAKEKSIKTTYRLKGAKVCFLLTNNYNINWIHSKAKQRCSHKSIPLVGTLFCWSISRAEKLYRTIMSSTTERHPGMQTIQSTTCERYSEWLHHLLPFPLLRWESKQGYKKTPMGCGRFVYSAISLKSQHSLLSSHLRLTQRKDCAAQGGEKTRSATEVPSPLKDWHEMKFHKQQACPTPPETPP